MKKEIVFGLICLLLFNGCSLFEEEDEACLDIGIPAITLHVEHAETGDPVSDVFAVAREGAYSDSVFISNTEVSEIGLATGRPGSYQVLAGGSDFVTWSRENVTVQSGECHPQTVELQATLEPVPK